jgi:hypothetical protein
MAGRSNAVISLPLRAAQHWPWLQLHTHPAIRYPRRMPLQLRLRRLVLLSTCTAPLPPVHPRIRGKPLQCCSYRVLVGANRGEERTQGHCLCAGRSRSGARNNQMWNATGWA